MTAINFYDSFCLKLNVGNSKDPFELYPLLAIPKVLIEIDSTNFDVFNKKTIEFFDKNFFQLTCKSKNQRQTAKLLLSHEILMY